MSKRSGAWLAHDEWFVVQIAVAAEVRRKEEWFKSMVKNLSMGRISKDEVDYADEDLRIAETAYKEVRRAGRKAWEKELTRQMAG